MAWTDVELYAAAQTINATETTVLKNNINYLHDGNATTYHHPGTGGNYTVTGELGQDIDSTNFSLSLTTNGGLVMACFYGQFMCSAAPNSIRASIIRVENVSYRGRNLFYDFDIELVAANATGEFRGWIKPFPGLPAGTHTFRVVWGISPAGTGTLLIGYRPRMSVWEMK